MLLKESQGGRLYITERGAVITNVDAEVLGEDFDLVLGEMSNEQRQYLHGRIGRVGLVPVFLGIHKGGVDLVRMDSIHDPLTKSQVEELHRLFSLGGE